MDIKTIRDQYPQYGDLSDEALMDGLHKKFYSDLPREEFLAKMVTPTPAGSAPQQPAAAPPKPFNILPFSEGQDGVVRFDTDAGIVGAGKRTATMANEVRRGEIDPTSEEGARRTLESALMLTPMGAAARTLRPIAGPGYKQPPTKAPTREALRQATKSGYDEARNMGVEYNPNSVSLWATRIADDLNAEGRIPNSYPKVHGLLDELKIIPSSDAGGATTVRLEAIDALYRELGRLGADPNEGTVAAIAQRRLDDFHNQMGPDDISVSSAANPERAASVLRDARDNAAAGFRSDRVTGMERTAARRTAAANSGRNVDNAIRQRLTSLIEGTKTSRGLSADEEAFIDTIIFGTPQKNAARYIGNSMGGGGGLGAMFLGGGAGVAGAATLGPVGALLAVLPPAIGATFRGIANRMSKAELKELDDLIRSRSALARDTPPPVPVYQPGVVQGGMSAALRGGAANNLPVYQPAPRQGPPAPQGGMTQEMMRRLLASPGGA